jgi:prepilin-type N-terminal cleavage/methylation domain-containing protein
MRARPAFSLVEVIVAITLIGVAVASVTASSAFASRALRAAEDREAVVRLGASLLDSLTAMNGPVAGTRSYDQFDAQWEADAGGIRVTITPRPGAPMPPLTLRAVQLPRLVRAPCADAPC